MLRSSLVVQQELREGEWKRARVLIVLAVASVALLIAAVLAMEAATPDEDPRGVDHGALH